MQALWLAFLNSWRGLVHGVRTERALRLEFALLLLGVPLSLLVGETVWTRVALVASLLLMLSAEFLNTAIEKLCDHLHPAQHPVIGTVKDLASAGAFFTQVLVALVWFCAVIDWIA